MRAQQAPARMNGAMRVRGFSAFALVCLLTPHVATAQRTTFAPRASNPAPGLWQPIGPVGATVLSQARDPADPAILFVGVHFGGIHKSIDAGVTWTHIPTVFSGQGVGAIEILPTTPRTMYVATLESGVYRSRDDGVTWTPCSNGIDDLVIRDLAIDPANNNHILAGTFTGVYGTVNGGDSWTLAQTDASFLPGVQLAFDPVDPTIVYAGSQGLGIHRSLDGGATWTSFSAGVGNRDIVSIVFDPSDSNTLYAAATDGVFRLSRGDTIWQNLTFDLPDTARIAQLTTLPAHPGLFAATDANIYQLASVPAPGSPVPNPPPSWTIWREQPARLLFADPTGAFIHLASFFNFFMASADDGQTWHDASTGIQNHFIGALAAVDTGQETALFAGTGNDVLVTADSFNPNGPRAWATIDKPGGAIFELTPDETNPGTIYGASEVGGVRVTRDYGATWTNVSTGLVPPGVSAIDQDRAGAGALYAGTSAGVFVSSDDGATWTQRFQQQNPAPITDIEADPVAANWVYYTTGAGQVFRATDGGDIFVPVWSAPPGDHLVQLESAPFMQLYAVSSSGSLYTSDDFGVNFFRRGEQDIPERVLCVAVNERRPWIAYVGTEFGGVYKSASSAINWTQKSKGLDKPIVFSIAVHPVNDDVLYAGSVDGVYKSKNAAQTWTKISVNLPSGLVTNVKIDPNKLSRIYAAVAPDPDDPAKRVLYRSDDSGRFWSLVSHGGAFNATGAIFPSATTPGRVFVGAALKGLFRSDDTGASWSASSNGMSPITLGLAIHPSDPNTLFAGSASSGVYRTSDAADTWTNVGLRDVTTFNMAIAPTNPSLVFAASSLGVMKSSDRGQSWGVAGQKSAFTLHVATDPQNANIVYVSGVGGQVFRSDNAGIAWRRANTGLPLLQVQAFAIDPQTGALYAALERDAVYRSTDRGDTWSRISLKPMPWQFLDMQIDPRRGDLYLATNSNGLLKSRDGGATWRRIDIGFTSDFVSSIALQRDARGRTTIFAGALNDPQAELHAITLPSGLYRSMDRGKTWKKINVSGGETNVFAIAQSRSPVGSIFAATGGGVFRSDDYGAQWTFAGAGLGAAQINALAIDDATGDVYAAGNAGMFVSDDNGATWRKGAPAPLFPNTSPVDIAIGAPGTAFVATQQHGVIMTRDTGATWIGGVSFNLTEMVPHMVAVDPVDSDILYAALQTQGVAKSEDGGLTWRLTNNGLGPRTMFTITIDISNPSTIYATSNDQGVWVSDDAGANWAPLNDGLFNPFVTALAIDPRNPRILYAGTEGGGVFRMVRP